MIGDVAVVVFCALALAVVLYGLDEIAKRVMR